MRSVLFFAIAALAIAGLMPKVMSSVGSAPAPQSGQARNIAPPPPQPTSNYRTVTVRSDARGHFQVEGAVDGRRLDFMVDTGASMVVLRERDAARLGIFPTPRDYTGRSSTANGIVKVAPVRLSSLEVNGIRVYDVSAAVIPDESLSVNLLGMSFLSRVRRFEMANGRLVMEQ
ncbi:MAG: aspartyl protease family protein [Hyphomicrobiales bacterium]|jgi:aspartyl protease family protein|nr:aspartyl protease family protein [Hyphomicrobiales bacterium]